VKKRSPTARRSLKLNRGGASPSKSSRQIREDLVLELYGRLRDALSGLGISTAEQRHAQARLTRLKTPPRVSGPFLRDWALLSAILLEWSRESEYLDDAGMPRVLTIRGSDASFESLAHRFLPNVRLEDVVTMACETAEVVMRPGGRIALLGGIMVNHAKSPERTLALAVSQIDQLLNTMVHNFVSGQTGRGAGRMQRIARGVIARGEFDEFMRELRPQIHDLLMRVEAVAENHRPKSVQALRSATAVSVGVNVGQEDDLERAGVDTSLVPLAERRRAKLKKR
jgi:hypothetical protein